MFVTFNFHMALPGGRGVVEDVEGRVFPNPHGVCNREGVDSLSLALAKGYS